MLSTYAFVRSKVALSIFKIKTLEKYLLFKNFYKLLIGEMITLRNLDIDSVSKVKVSVVNNAPAK